jgi:hypothetical protein
MAIQTRIQPRQTFWNCLYIVLCLGLGIWGWYDYSVKIPGNEAAFAEYSAAEKVKSTLEKQVQTTPLTDAEKTDYKAALEILTKYKEKPAEPAAYDRAVQLWLYIVGCGLLGVPWFAIAQWRLSRVKHRLEDNGDLIGPEGLFPASEIADIDMSSWMSKSIALVVTRDGRRTQLDDYKYQGTEEIVATLAARFHPGKWTSDARPIGDPKSRDTKAAAAGKSAESVLEQPADQGRDPQGSDNDPRA